MSLAIKSARTENGSDFTVEIPKTIGQQLSLHIYNLEGKLLFSKNEVIPVSPMLNKIVRLCNLNLEKGFYMLMVSDGISYHFGSLAV
ncbi:MAG: hypothetical protein IPM47_08435 [Sphingobacteriales bacterium]|nr:MAG: hypothetical protein IPM47_08435 [Sphingobacteriales bacterium]